MNAPLALEITLVDASAAPALVAELAELLVHTVAHGASIGFLAPLALSEAEAYWQAVCAGLQDGEWLWVARVAGQLVGTVQLSPCPRANGRNRAEVCKLMVHADWRGQGIASLLMAALEGKARKLERGLLFLDTEAGSGAEALYQSLGYKRVGEIPDYAASPDGRLRPTALYYKLLIERSLNPLPGAESEA
jgi:acetyltransferase